MSFQPVVTLTEVPRDNTSFTLKDATPTDNISGWGSPNAPAGPESITSIFGQLQAYGEVPIDIVGVSGTLLTTLTFPIDIQDGVNTYYAYYGLPISLTDYTVSSDGKSITSNDANLITRLAGVSAIALLDGTFPTQILSVSGNTITLADVLTPNQTGQIIYIYYRASVQALTINNGESLIVNGISLLPLEANDCQNSQSILDSILLKIGAEIAFGCGNLSKAHEAAKLLSGNKPSVTNNCATCG